MLTVHHAADGAALNAADLSRDAAAVIADLWPDDRVPIQALVIQLSDVIDAALAQGRRDAEEAYGRGYRAALETGYRRGREHEAEDWLWVIDPAREAARRASRGPTFRELDRRRYPPDGRLSWQHGRGAA